MNILAIDLGGTFIKIGLVNEGKVLASSCLDSKAQNGLRSRLPEIEAAIQSLCRDQGIAVSHCRGVGIVSAGLVDFCEKHIVSTNDKFNDLASIDFADWANTAFQLPLRIENDAHAALLGEWKYGAGKSANNLVMMGLGTGIGTSVILQQKPLRGKNGQAGLLGGHIMMDPDGPECTCPSRGCAEALASTWAIQNLLNSIPNPMPESWQAQSRIDFEWIFQRYDESDDFAQIVVERALKVWSAVAVSMVHLFAPERLIIGGGVSRRSDVIVPFIQDWVDRHCWIGWDRVEVISAQHPDTAGLLGAEVLFQEDIEYL